VIEIAGGGLRGISCALELLNNNLEVTIFEARQEIGNPVRSPGIIKKLDSELIEISVAKRNQYGWALRREWLEKILAKQVVDQGGIIRLKTKAPLKSIDCSGGKSSAPGWPLAGNQQDLVKWKGGIVIKTDIPSEFNLDEMSEDRFCFERGDNLVECWIRGSLPRPNQGWLEIMEGEHPRNVDKIWADESIIEGKIIAKNIIKSLMEVS
tara:strand:+ start:858 stop:1484 length:627 start_codon:yes stop_codon:yes gene_type:complete